MTTNVSRQPSGDYFAARFGDYVVRALEFALQTVQAAPANFSADLRSDVQNWLDLGLQADFTWPLARDLLLTVAPRMELAGSHDEWMRSLVQACRQSIACQDWATAAECQLQLGLLHRLHGNFEQAQRWLCASEVGFAKLGHRLGQARALNQLAYEAWQQHDTDEAVHLAQQALALLDDQDPERAMSLSALGLVAIDHRQWQEAEMYHRAALQLRTAAGDLRKMAWSLQNLGYALRGQQHYTEAISCFEEALDLLQKVGDKVNGAVVQMNLGIAYSVRGDPARALTFYTAAEAVFRATMNRHNLARVLTSKGLDYYALAAWDEAAQAFAASAGLFKTLNDDDFYVNALDGLGMTYLKQGQIERAETTLQQGLAEVHKVKDPIVQARRSADLTKHLHEAQAQRRAD